MNSVITIHDVMTDNELFGGIFGKPSWDKWRALLKGFYGLPLSDSELEAWTDLTQRERPPEQAFTELWLVVGRRGGKTQAAALLAVFEAVFNDFTPKLSPGEMAYIMVMAADRKQARSAFRYISGLLNSNPMLKALIVREDKESITLSNRAIIEVHTSSFRAVRGYSIACCIADEIAFWRSEDTANPDHEIINALRPAMATLDGRLLALSSPYSKRGALYDAYKRYYGTTNSSILVAQAESRTMNPNLPAQLVEQALERDHAAAACEYLAQFRSDLESFVKLEVVEACVIPGRYELPPLSSEKYFAFVDPSGGSVDSMTIAIGHREKSQYFLDAIREIKPPFSPDGVVKIFADLMKSYRISKVYGDRFAGEWCRERFREHGITYEISPKPRTGLYLDFLPMLMSGLVELLDDKRLVTQICSLERRTGRSGRDTIDHAPGAHDDLANAVAGVFCCVDMPTAIDYSQLI